MELPVVRPRRLRRTPALRRLVAETHVRPEQLILPVFVREGITEPQPIAAMPGVVQHTLDSLVGVAREAADAGLGGIMVFGVPVSKDARGSGADDPDGILNVALRRLADEVGDRLVVMADLCLDEFTDHGHCGVLTADGRVVVSGLGKSGHVARKIAATLASTGTPAFFLHPAEAGHGDLGSVGRNDVALVLSWSGETLELRALVEYCQRFGNKLIAATAMPMTSDPSAATSARLKVER